jgi:hypothetical protein
MSASGGTLKNKVGVQPEKWGVHFDIFFKVGGTLLPKQCTFHKKWGVHFDHLKKVGVHVSPALPSGSAAPDVTFQNYHQPYLKLFDHNL